MLIVRCHSTDYNTFLALETADGRFAKLSAYFDGSRIKRNASEYDFAGGVIGTAADGLLKTVQQFAIDAETWAKYAQTLPTSRP